MNSYVQDPKATFQKQWTTAYVPAILCYGEKTKKKGIGTILSEMNKLGQSKFGLCDIVLLNYYNIANSFLDNTS